MRSIRLLIILMIVLMPCKAGAEVYLTEEQAAASLFPGIHLEPVWIQLNPQEIKTIEKSSQERVRSPKVRVWWGPEKQSMIIDQVLGKHELITYALAINSDGTVKGIEI